MDNSTKDQHRHSHIHGLRRAGNQKSLTIALGITFVIMFTEAAGGWLTNSLALLSDAVHMLSDVGALALSLVAVWLAAKPASSGKSYGYHRFEILAALFNGMALFAVAAIIIREAYGRITQPPSVDSLPMMAIAVAGLAANLVCAWVLLKHGDVKDNINLRSAYLHVLSDALGSVGAILAGFLMYQFGWYIADPIISVVVSLMILKGAWTIVRQAVHILMEGAPGDTDVAVLANALSAIDGVANVHDVHVWTVASGYEVFSCHILTDSGISQPQILAQATELVEKRFGIKHTTIQVEETVDKDCRSCKGRNCTFF